MSTPIVTILVPAAFAVAGMLIYVLTNAPSPTSPKVAEVGRLMLFCGLFWLVWVLAAHELKF
jgi:hypothetical protein